MIYLYSRGKQDARGFLHGMKIVTFYSLAGQVWQTGLNLGIRQLEDFIYAMSLCLSFYRYHDWT